MDELRIVGGKDTICTPEFLGEIEVLFNETLANYLNSVHSTNGELFLVS